MCRVVPEVPKEKLVLSTADPKPAAYQVPLIIPTCPSKDAQLDTATASAQSLDLQLHHHTHTTGGHMIAHFHAILEDIKD
jgi:hypothetical protein